MIAVGRVVGAGDFDNDGQADLVWENSATGEREIWLMKNGAPTTAIHSRQWIQAGILLGWEISWVTDKPT